MSGPQLSSPCPILKEKVEGRRQSFSRRTLLLGVTETITSFVWGQAAGRDEINLEPQRGCTLPRKELGFIYFSGLVRQHLLHFSDERRRLRKGRWLFTVLLLVGDGRVGHCPFSLPRPWPLALACALLMGRDNKAWPREQELGAAPVPNMTDMQNSTSLLNGC